MAKKKDNTLLYVGLGAAALYLLSKNNNMNNNISGLKNELLIKESGSSLDDATNKLINYGLGITSFNVIAPKHYKFYANEKNGDLSQVALDIMKWAKKNGLGMTSKPKGKSKITDYEIYKGKRQTVINQWTEYTIK